LSNRISKEDFLGKLTSGDYIPIKLNSKDSLIYYKLFILDESSNSEIRQQIRRSSTANYIHFKAEGKTFPEFQFIDLNGVVYNSENTKGKIVILKCWFITCHACVAEFPELNKLVDNYRNRKDIVFISLATDSKEKLNQFLLQKKFNYAVVADQEKFITKELNVSTYPTHIIIDRNGVIRKVVNSADEMILALSGKEFLETSQAQIPPPPAPK
jgi:peroxiredoxin